MATNMKKCCSKLAQIVNNYKEKYHRKLKISYRI